MALLILSLTACGGGGGGSKPGNPGQKTVSISILPKTASVEIGKSVTLTVNAQNTDFTVSSTPASGSGCVKSGGSVACTPTRAGTYDITVTASADTTKTATARITVSNPPVPVHEIEVIESPGEIDETVYADGRVQKTVTFTATGNWTASIADMRAMNIFASLSASTDVSTLAALSDCSIDIKSGGAGTHTITITCRPNTAAANLVIDVKISTANDQVVITITQKPAPRNTDFTPVSYPDPGSTALYGINNNGAVIGEFYDVNRSVKAFVKDGATYTAIAPPGASGNVYVYGINDSGQILGRYDNRYFLKTGNAYQNLANYPNAYLTDYTGINNSGKLVGYFTDANGYSRGFIKDGANFTAIDYPGASAAVCASYQQCGTRVTGINNLGQVVGVYRSSDGRYRGFVKNGNNYIPIDHPDSPFNIYVTGINDSGQVAGYFWGSDGYAYGFVKDGGRFIEIIPPATANDGEGAYVYGINNSGRIAGWFDAGAKAHGFTKEF